MRPSSGLRGGLTVILDQQSDMISTGTLVEDYSGFRISVFSKVRRKRVEKDFSLTLMLIQDETPLATDKSLLISPGHVKWAKTFNAAVINDRCYSCMTLLFQLCNPFIGTHHHRPECQDLSPTRREEVPLPWRIGTGSLYQLQFGQLCHWMSAEPHWKRNRMHSLEPTNNK